MRRIVLVDLDDTLFQSSAKNPSATQPAAVDKDGIPLSFCCDRQVAFLDWLARDALVVPVTGRSVDAFRRVRIAFSDHAICSFGGVILAPDGTVCAEWHQRMADAAGGTAAPLTRLHAEIAATATAHAIDVRHRVIEDAELPLYLSVKHNSGSGAETSRLAEAIAPLVPAEWTLHVNGYNLALLPPFLGKAKAVAFLLDRLVGTGGSPALTIGVGDSLTDAGYMALCDYAIAPTKSQIWRMLPQPAGFAPAATGAMP